MIECSPNQTDKNDKDYRCDSVYNSAPKSDPKRNDRCGNIPWTDGSDEVSFRVQNITFSDLLSQCSMG